VWAYYLCIASTLGAVGIAGVHLSGVHINCRRLDSLGRVRLSPHTWKDVSSGTCRLRHFSSECNEEDIHVEELGDIVGLMSA